MMQVTDSKTRFAYPACGCAPAPVTPVLSRRLVDGVLIRDLKCLKCAAEFSETLGEPEAIFVDFRTQRVVERRGLSG